HLPGEAPDWLGPRPCGEARGPEALVLPLDRPPAVPAGSRAVGADRVLHPVHKLERHLEPVRAARLAGAGAVLWDVMRVFTDRAGSLRTCETPVTRYWDDVFPT